MAGIGTYKPIKLVKYTTTIDSNGNNVEGVDVVYKMWAEITSGGGSRTLQKERTSMSDTKTFKFMFKGYNLDPDFKIQYFGQVYAISSIERINEQRFNWQVTAYSIFEIPSVSIGTSGGGGGGGSVTTILNFSDGTPTTATGSYLRFGLLADPNSTLEIVSDKPFKIRYPDGNVYSYPSCRLYANYSDFSFAGLGNLDFYYANDMSLFNISWSGQINVVPTVWPTAMNIFLMHGSIENTFTMPTLANQWDIQNNNLTDAAINDILAQCVAMDKDSGNLYIRRQNNRLLQMGNYSDYYTLIQRSWNIQ